jgi:hypothetical protein
MSQTSAWLLLLSGFMQGPFEGQPTIYILPASVQPRAWMSGGDFGYTLVTEKICAEQWHGVTWDVQQIQARLPQRPDGSPILVRVFVNALVFAPEDVRRTAKRIRASWDHEKDQKHPVTITFEFAPMYTTSD